MELEDAESWNYRGEGAANLVLAYRGRDPALIGKILRLRKAVKNDKGVGNGVQGLPTLTAEEQRVWGNWPYMVSATTIAELNHCYARDVLHPLLGDEHVDPGSLVHVSSWFVDTLNRNIEHKRPEWRAESGSLEALAGVGLLMSDHTHFPFPPGNLPDSPVTIAVEIKPKCGFLPTSSMIMEKNHIKKKVSRFTMHQHLKFCEGKIKHLSKYDPLDLFSGTKDGILKAVQALFETPQNNLRLFLDGEEVFGESKGSSMCANLTTAHLENILEGFVTAPAGERILSFQKLVADLLFESDVLKRLLAVQRLDYCDIEGAIQVHDEFLNYYRNLPATLENSHKSSAKLLETQNPGSYLEGMQLDNRFSQGHEVKFVRTSVSFENSRKILQDFLISTTAKDCGMMVTLQPLGQRNVDVVPVKDVSIVVNSSGQSYLQKVLLLDLDVKRLKQMHHYWKLDQEIVQAYASSLAP